MTVHEEELLRRIRELEEKNGSLNQRLKEHRYGLTWMEEPETFDPESKNKIPVLEEVKGKSFTDRGDQPTHILIEGDNYHALTCLRYTHKGKIDVIYIDPPYNTGNDGFTYKDKRFLTQYPDGTPVPKDHPLRHSYWLSFMQKRLELAKNLLKDDGVIFISIDDNEQANLKLLCDTVFLEKNFVATMIWKSKSGGANDSSSIATDHEYVLCYSKNINKVTLNNDLEAVVTTQYNKEDSFGRYSLDRLDKQNLGYNSSLDFPIIGPDGKEYVVEHKDPNNKKARWRWGRDTVAERYDELVFIYPYVYTKNYEKKDGQKPRTILFDERFGRTRTGSTDLKKIIPEQTLFSYPKPVALMKYLLQISTSRKDTCIILDFFAGSGTTLHATLKLNAEDGGKRQCILVQQNEGEKHICEEVTYERNRRVMQGYTNAKGEKIAGLGGSLKYYKTAFTGAGKPDRDPIMRPSDEDRVSLAQNAGVLVSLAENTLYETAKNDFFQIFTDNHGKFAAVYLQEDLSHFEIFKQEVEKLNGQVAVYIFSWGSTPDAESSFRHLPNVSVKAYPNAILESYKQAYQQLENNK